jgi:P27 family predicted phage terminase small subunit
MTKRGRQSAAALAVPKPIEPARKVYASLPKAPPHLSESARAWWRDVVSEFELEPHHLRLLESACGAWDRMAEARRALAAHGALTYTDERGKILAHPAVAIERDARTAFARLLRELDLDASGPKDAPRPPALQSNRG